MPTVTTKSEHREKLQTGDPLFNACVARSVGKAEIAANKSAQAALDKERDRLVKAKAWDETKVAEWSVIAAKHRADGTKAHIGRVFEICTEKGSEFPAGHPDRKYKGRSVYPKTDSLRHGPECETLWCHLCLHSTGIQSLGGGGNAT